MQTKQQIRQLLAAANVRPNKRIGQNFLIDLNLSQKLVDSANICKNDLVLEVGCGTGSLTEAIASYAGRCLAVELDHTLAEIAKKQLADKQNVEIINADILKNKHTLAPKVSHAIASARNKHPGRFLLVANLPYSIASPLISNLIMGPAIADAMYVTVQKEVADRMTAPPGGKHYGTLSIFLSATGNVKTIRTLKPTVFWPPPKVSSAMVAFVRDEKKAGRIKNMDLLNEIVGLFMQHRRKMLKTCTRLAAGNLAEIKNWPEIFKQSRTDPNARPEQLSPENYIAIANLCCKNKKHIRPAK